MDELIPDPTPAKLPTGVVYAGFWRRFNAYGIDATIVWCITVLIDFILFGAAESTKQLHDVITAFQQGDALTLLSELDDGMANSASGGSVLGADTNIMIGVSALYNILFGVSIWRGTPGKYWLKCKIVMRNGERMNLQQSIIRHAATALSAIAWMVPCITVFFTPEKLAPHDMIVGTRVIMR